MGTKGAIRIWAAFINHRRLCALSHRDLQIVRPEFESSSAGIACGQLLAVSTAERRGWYWPKNKDARRWPVRWLPRWPKAYLYALSGAARCVLWT